MKRLTQKELKQRYAYDPNTGMFSRRTINSKHGHDKPVGNLHSTGYLHIGVAGMVFKAHRLVWLYVHGRFPRGMVDHINRNKLDNRISNLREVTRGENIANSGVKSNNTSGFVGVTKRPRCPENPWHARITVRGVRIPLGFFATPEEAGDAYAQAYAKHYGSKP